MKTYKVYWNVWAKCSDFFRQLFKMVQLALVPSSTYSDCSKNIFYVRGWNRGSRDFLPFFQPVFVYCAILKVENFLPESRLFKMWRIRPVFRNADPVASRIFFVTFREKSPSSISQMFMRYCQKLSLYKIPIFTKEDFVPATHILANAKCQIPRV